MFAPILLSSSGRLRTIIVFSLLTIGLSWFAAATWGRQGKASGGAESFQGLDGALDRSQGEKQNMLRIREGTKLLDKIGHFTVSGDSVSFRTADGKLELNGLPNLNLERVAGAITDDAANLEWSVSGHVTEFRGVNYLYVTRATLKTKAAGRGDLGAAAK